MSSFHKNNTLNSSILICQPRRDLTELMTRLVSNFASAIVFGMPGTAQQQTQLGQLKMQAMQDCMTQHLLGAMLWAHNECNQGLKILVAIDRKF